MKSVSKPNKYIYKRNQIFKYCLMIMLILLLIGVIVNFYSYTNSKRYPKNSGLKKFFIIRKENSVKKKILFWGKFFYFNTLETHCIKDNRDMDFCPYKCEYSVNQTEASIKSSDAIIIHGREDPEVLLPTFRLPHQRWVFIMEESAQHSWTNISHLNNTFNWTMTHRTDSDIFFGYGSLLNGSSIFNTSLLLKRQLVAWAASNCAIVSSDRKTLVEEISKHMDVDTFGACGKFPCPRRPASMWMCDFPQMCSELLGKRYKFYLAFENSVCSDYITEKFFNALKFNMVPVVLGPSREFYEKHVPPHAFIHVEDFQTVQELADYIKYLDENDYQYLKYFEWKKKYEIDPVNYYKRGWCNLCTKLYLEKNDDQKTTSYPSIHQWWFYPKNLSACHTTKVVNGAVVKIESKSMGEKH